MSNRNSALKLAALKRQMDNASTMLKQSLNETDLGIINLVCESVSWVFEDTELINLFIIYQNLINIVSSSEYHVNIMAIYWWIGNKTHPARIGRAFAELPLEGQLKVLLHIIKTNTLTANLGAILTALSFVSIPDERVCESFYRGVTCDTTRWANGNITTEAIELRVKNRLKRLCKMCTP